MKRIVAMLVFIIMISISGIVVEVEADGSCKTIRVYGTVEIDGEEVEGADIIVIDTYDDNSEITTTNETGCYEVYIVTKNNREIEVSVDFDEHSNDKTFEVEPYMCNYEVNFDFEAGSTIIVVSKIVDLIWGCGAIKFISSRSFTVTSTETFSPIV
ncbi:unnamed protein product [marine sediment metagenome]|uniref:Carboxypeptidase regulatory-like domain-containing protein n=1 Tax=marine sediment metagenome TaxID=412755 RepID=X1BEX9_9ZZZZ